MVYGKPEIVLLGTSFGLIQGSKVVGFEPTSPVIADKAADSELDD